MKLCERNRPLSCPTAHDHIGIHRREGNRHVGRMSSDAALRPAEDRVRAIDAGQCCAAGTGSAFVAGEVVAVSEVRAARALHDVATDRCHVPQLARRREQQSFGDYWEPPPDFDISGNIAHPGECADAKAAVWERFNLPHPTQPIDVEQALGQCRTVLDETQEIGSTGDEGELRIVSVSGDCHRCVDCS